MPVRCTIHSSDVSTFVASSAFETARAGSAEPTPRTQARIEAGARPCELPVRGVRGRRTRGGGDARFMSVGFSVIKTGRRANARASGRKPLAWAIISRILPSNS